MLSISRITVVIALLWIGLCTGAHAQESEQEMMRDPLRLSYTEGDVSFWRAGAQNWARAQLNIPLAAGDALYTGNNSDLELQMGSRVFVRAASDSQLALVNQTSDFTQFRITTGSMAFDLRMLPAGHVIEVDTPNAAFTIDHIGYYRVDVNGEVRFITRRGGRAVVIPADGEAMAIRPSEEVVVQGGDTVARVETYVAPELDGWDHWNYARTDGQVDTVSERYLSPGVAGAYDLDQYGNWRVVPQYGSVWVPSAVPAGWSPYSDGRWVWDPYYQWTWIDNAPWGWAPFHYGRWVNLNSYWAWVPGPVTRHAIYSPALVAFFGIGAGVSVDISLGWVALGWGEPLIPWWGPSAFIGRPWWGGWGGPRIVNNIVIQRGTTVNVTNIRYANTHISNAMITAGRGGFGQAREHSALGLSQVDKLRQIRGALPVKPGPENLMGNAIKGIRPPEHVLSRPVVTARPSPEYRLPWHPGKVITPERAVESHVTLPKHSIEDLPQPGFGSHTGAERPHPPQLLQFEEQHRAGPAAGNGVSRISPRQVEPNTSGGHSPYSFREQPGRVVPGFNGNEAGVRSPGTFYSPERIERGPLPGRPANQMYRRPEFTPHFEGGRGHR